MPKCPNCGQTTARTGDWACQWCGYPLLSNSYKKIPKTYKQLKEENLPKPRAPVGDEPEPEPESVAELEPEPVAELEPEPKPEPEPELAPEIEPAAHVELATELEPEPVAEPELAPETEPVAHVEPVAEPEPAAIELTVEELLSAYAMEGVAADAKFANKILKVTGVVDRIEVKDTLNIYYINLTSAETNLLQHVRCVFDRKYGVELNKLTRGQTATVQGKYDGSIIDISMRDCVLVH